ncbi:MAG TPA: porin [Verrucomicrobiae bacterium]
MKINRWLLGTIIGTQFAFASVAADESATNGDADISALKQQIQELDQKVRVLERKDELDKADAEAAAKKQPLIKLDGNGFAFTSADKNFSVGIHGQLQLDSRTFFENNVAPGADGFLLRRARPIISGTVFHDFDYVFMPDFGGSSTVIQDAFINYHYNPALQLQIGKFKSPVGLEYLQSVKNWAFNELSLASDLVPNRDLGVELHGDLFGGILSYAAGIFNGVADGANTSNSDFDNEKEFAGRIFVQPLKKSGLAALQGIGFGLAGSYGDEAGASSSAGYKTEGQQKLFGYRSTVTGDGAHWRIAPQAYYYYGPFGLLGEYVESSQKVAAGANTATLENNAWEVTASWILTGEKNSYKGITPDHPFDVSKNHWGAVGLFARYAQLDIDSDAFPIFADPTTSAKSATDWSVGLSWWLNNNIRVMTSFSHTTFSGGGSGSVTGQDENTLFTRVQLAF